MYGTDAYILTNNYTMPVVFTSMQLTFICLKNLIS